MTGHVVRFIIEPLDPERHDRERFDCGVVALNDFLQKRARKEMDVRTSACFVLVAENEQDRIAGYYTLSAAEIALTDLPPEIAKKLPRYDVLPATLLGRLARDLAFRGQGIGDRLMHDALARASRGSAEIGSIAVVTDPKEDEHVIAFYREFNFLQLNERRRLFLPMKDIKWLLESKR